MLCVPPEASPTLVALSRGVLATHSASRAFGLSMDRADAPELDLKGVGDFFLLLGSPAFSGVERLPVLVLLPALDFALIVLEPPDPEDRLEGL